MSAILQKIQKATPGLADRLGLSFGNMLQNKCHDIPESWNFSLSKPFSQSLALVNEEIVPAIHSGKIVPVAGIRAVTDSRTVKLEDGNTISDIDTIIFCTGYKANFSLFADSPYDPTKHTAPEWSTIEGSKNLPLPYLYQNIFSIDFPDSLASTFYCGFQMPVFQIFDLASMALAQVWKGNSSLPPKEEMIREADAYQRWMCERARLGSLHPDLVRVPDWYRWINDTAGTGLNEHLGYGIEGWKFWAKDRKLSNLLLWGIWSPHIYRLFETSKRKSWSGARDEIESVNRERPQKPE
jgi:dimethylaniline monooxygenase (N-oxide forming)